VQSGGVARPGGGAAGQLRDVADFAGIGSGMRYDYSWNHPGQHYPDIYELMRHE